MARFRIPAGMTLALAGLIGFVIGWLVFRLPQWACGPFRADKAAEWSGAIASFAAATVALSFGVGEIVKRRRESRTRAKWAAVMLWPDLRRYSSCLKRLGATAITHDDGPLTDSDRLEITRAYGSLAAGSEQVGTYGRDLAGNRPLQLARVMANVRHVVRHTAELLTYDDALSQSNRRGKQRAIRLAIKEARDDLLPLIKHSYAVIGHSKKVG